MATEGQTAMCRDVFSLDFYKRSQGRIARQATFGVLVVAVALGVWSIQDHYLGDLGLAVRYSISGLLFLAGLWLCFRAVNVPRIADFLIAVEAEMNKVSWPSRKEMFRSAIVVMITIFGLAAVLFGYDLVWRNLLQLLRVLPG